MTTEGAKKWDPWLVPHGAAEERSYAELHASAVMHNRMTPALAAFLVRSEIKGGGDLRGAGATGGYYYRDMGEWRGYREAQFDAWSDPTPHLDHSIAKHMSDLELEQLLEVERSNAAKFYSSWRLHATGRELMRQPLWLEGPNDPEFDEDQACDFVSKMLGFCLLESKGAAPGWESTRVRMGTQGGWPVYPPGSQTLENELLLAPTAFELPISEGLDLLKSDAGEHARDGLGDTPVAIRGTRTQEASAAKPGVNATNYVEHKYIKYEPAPGYPKVRAIYMFGRAANQYMFSITNYTFWLLHMLPVFPANAVHGFEILRASVAPWWITLAEDATTYDLTIGYKLLRAALRGLEKHISTGAPGQSIREVERRSFKDLINLILTMPLVGNAHAAGYGMLYDRLGTLPSGMQLTSVIGSIINLLRACWMFAPMYGGSLWRAFLGLMAGDWAFIAQSDDCVTSAPPEFWAKARSPDRLGFRVKQEKPLVYLQHFLDMKRGAVHMLASRAALGTINNETNGEPRHRNVASLGVALRRHILRHGAVPALAGGNPFWAAYDHVLKAGRVGTATLKHASSITLAELEAIVAARAHTAIDSEAQALWETFGPDSSLGRALGSLELHELETMLEGRVRISLRLALAHCRASYKPGRLGRFAGRRIVRSLDPARYTPMGWSSNTS